jgi:hypothetical protein
VDNPISIHEDVEKEWDALPLVDRVVIDSPVPLNEEQIKILSALRNPVGRIIVVEGPPGTGKSHTITAIAADCALRDRSCLILSDKTEALDVVQNKLTDAMNQVRHDKRFPNPILRLGQDQANFKRLTSNQALAQVSAYVKASKANQPHIAAELTSRKDALKRQIGDTVATLGMLGMAQIANVYAHEARLEELSPGLAAQLQAVRDEEAYPVVVKADDASSALREYLRSVARPGAADFQQQVAIDAALHSISNMRDTRSFALFDQLSIAEVRKVAAWLHEYDQLKMPLFGYIFRGAAVRSIQARINGELSPATPITLKKQKRDLQSLVESAGSIRANLPDWGLNDEDFPAIYRVLSHGRLPPESAALLHEIVKILSATLPTGLPASLRTSDGPDGPDGFAERWLTTLAFLRCWIPVSMTFANAPDFD